IVAGAAILGDGRPARRAIVAVALAVAVVVLDGANRTLFRSGYPELHLALTIATIAVGGRALAIGIGTAAPRRRTRALTGAVIAIAAIATAAFGLGAAADRALVVNHGDDARHLVHAARALVDLDGDGVSPILSGGDCD